MPALVPLPRHRFLVYFVLWYGSSASAVLLSKHVFSSAFPFPLTVTASNNLIAASLSFCALRFAPCSQSQLVRAGSDEDETVGATSAAPSSSHNHALMGALIGAATALEIGLSNCSLQKLSVTFSTLLKGAAPLSIAIWSAVLGVAPLHPQTFFAGVGLIAGLGLCSAGQVDGARQGVQETRVGIGLQLAAAAISGLRWTLTQAFVRGVKLPFDIPFGWNRRPAASRGGSSLDTTLLLSPTSREDCESNCREKISTNGDSVVRERAGPTSPTQTILATAPATMACVVPFAMALEGRAVVRWAMSTNFVAFLGASQLVFVIGSMVFLLLWTEYELVRSHGAVSVSLLFVVKEVRTDRRVISRCPLPSKVHKLVSF